MECQGRCTQLEQQLSEANARAAFLEEELTRQAASLERLESTLQLQAEALVGLARNAGNAIGARYGVTGSVTQEEKEKKRREQGRVRQQAFRLRRASVTGAESNAAGSVTSPPPPSPNPSEGRGVLRVVTQAARYGERYGQPIHRSPDTLPPPVRALREAWNELAASRGFAEWGVTSARLLEEAAAALERRPLEEWRKVFSLVPRSPVCRGELGSRQRASYVWILSGRTREGYEPAECLLSGAWSLDPELEEQPEPGTLVDCDHLVPGLAGDSALAMWNELLAQYRGEGKTQALANLERCAPQGFESGVLTVWCEDSHASQWLSQIYAQTIVERLALGGVESVRFVAPEPAGKLL